MPAFSTEISATEHQYLRENHSNALPHLLQAIYMFYAVNLVGAIANMIHPLSAEKEIEFYLNGSEPGTDCELPYGEESEILLAGLTVMAESIP